MREIKRVSPALKDKIEKGEFMIVGAVYDIESGKVEFLDKTLGVKNSEPLKTMTH